MPLDSFQQDLIHQNAYQEQLDSLETATPLQIEPRIVNVWNEFKRMSSFELSTLAPFTIIFLVVNPAILDGINQINSSSLSELKWYRADIKGLGKKIVFPIAATKNIFETVNFQGGMGLTQFNIGYEGNIKQMTGSFSFNILSLDEFDKSFIAAAFLSPYNTLLTIHGWSGPGIWIDLPFHLQQGEEWKTQVESVNPGLWAMNTVSLYNRTFTPDETGYSCECTFVQHSTSLVGSSENSGDKSEPFKVSSGETKTFTTGSSQIIQENLIDKSILLSKMSNIYKDANYDYITNKLNSTWFNSQKDFLEQYSLKRIDENGTSEFVSEKIFYPLGMVIEAIIAAHFERNPLDSLMKISYEDLNNSSTEETLTLPPYRFSISDGNESKTFEIPINSAFDIPIPRERVVKILQKPDTQWKEAIYYAVSSIKPEYRLLQKGINRTLNNVQFDCSLEFAEQKIDREIAKNLEINEDTDLILEYRAQNSLLGPVSMETSNVNLESIAALGLNNILGERNKIFIDKDDSGNKEIKISSTKQPTNEEKYDYIADDNQDNDIQNAELITNLYADDSANRGFLLRLFSQMLNVDIHGLAGIIPTQICWIRGLTKGLNGKYCIYKIKDNITPESYTVNLQLINMNFSQDSTGLQELQNSNSENNNIEDVSSTTITTPDSTKKVGNLSGPINTGFGSNMLTNGF